MKKTLIICIYIFGCISLHAQNLCGFWKSSEYTCSPSVSFETFAISQNGTYVVSTKIIGDDCVKGNQITWLGNYQGPVFPVTFHVGSPDNPNCCWTAGVSWVIDDNHILFLLSSYNINIIKLSCHEVDSLGYKFSDYGLTCDCHIDEGQIIISPNPFQNFAYIHNNSNEQINKIQIFNALGQLIFSRNESISTIDLSHIKPAVYLYYIETESGKNYNGKIVKY